MDWHRIAIRIKDHPGAVIIAFVAAVVIPFAGFFIDVLSPFWAAFAIVSLVGAIIVFLVWPSGEDYDSQDNEAPQRPITSARPRASQNRDRLRSAVRQHYLAGFGEKALLDYFYERARVENQYDLLYRNVIESMKEDPTWGEIAHGVEEWVSIGFETLVNWQSGWKNSGTLNQLYVAAYRALLKGDLALRGGEEFAQTVASLVATQRRSGH